MRERFPDFLIIGAMKSGTTTLYRDLYAQASVFLPNQKEPHDLLEAGVVRGVQRENYSNLFRTCRPGQICGEASTQYSARPHYDGVPQRAKQLLGEKTRIVYLVRNPVDRTLSHYHHGYSKGEFDARLESAIESDSRLIDISRYAFQLEPWIEQFGEEAIKVIRFEDYVANRQAVTDELGEFLEFEPDADIDVEQQHNQTNDRRVWPRPIQKLIRSQVARRWLDPVMVPAYRDLAKRLLGRPGPPAPPPPAIEMIDYIIERSSERLDWLQSFMGREAPLWDLEATREKYTAAGQADCHAKR